MKIRSGFVSNSSSSSFVIDKRGLTKKQIEKIDEWILNSQDYKDGENLSYSDDNNFNESSKHYFGSISFHVNFFHFLEEIGIPKTNIDES